MSAGINPAAAQQVLQRIDDWPVGAAATALVDGDGVIATAGDVNRVFALASVTKPLSALATLVAVEEEALSLDDPAEEQLLPGATLRHLLAHASGVAPEGLLRSYPPAQRRVYSNVGYDLIGQLVAEATTMAFPAYLHEAVAVPLSLTDTVLEGSPARDGRSTVADLSAVLRELLNPRTLLHPSTLAEATSAQYPGLRGVLPGYGMRDPNDWGLGFELRAKKSPHWTGAKNSPQTYGHFGQSGTMFWVDPRAGLALVALADRPFGGWAAQAWPQLSDAVLGLLG
ncbi:CubicO group peptidase (beta-lactamase class C family) [Jatrophihabitans sp. GAS493]|uniref:serine hydrolase domain-containing protein n=1 Tax=Jatrophihabitans sp. GAS493 TaxID=1907575 RepID=UPI000BC0ACF9|nr:serine hydrolase domain-containing protein [Jatrophihabitans sp. GAS493]SOD73019.1 CubicO group peptidase (beta-lactamase class C family) [Jatrophihabitans sp. GAS493]